MAAPPGKSRLRFACLSLLILGCCGLFYWFFFLQGADGDAALAALPTGEESVSLNHLWETGVTDNGLSLLAKTHPGLESLTINGSSNITDRGILYISQLRGLKGLRLQRIRGVTDNGLRCIGELSVLEHLDLTGTGVIDDDLLLKFSKLEHLKSLVAGRNFHASDAAFAQFKKDRPECEVRLMK